MRALLVGAAALLHLALPRPAVAWQGAAGPNYYIGDNSLTLQSLGAYPDALCNDGTPAAYYFSQGTDPSLWVLYLEGGYWCVDEASCKGRMANEPQEMSSNDWPATVEAGGIFSRDSTQNPWAAANMVYAAYCSSDAWLGATEAFGFQFRGQAILAAVVADLRAQRGLAAGARLLFSGCSAGARGVMANLDALAGALPGVEVRGLIDSGLWVDATPADPSTTESLMEETQQVYAFVNAGALIPADCAAAYAGAEWKCLFGQYRFPYLQTPYFANEAQFDSFQIMYNLGGSAAPRYGFQVQWADAFQQTMLSVVSTLPAPGQSQSGMFSTQCLLHCVTNGPDFMTVTANGESLMQAASAWYFQGVAPQQIIDRSCTGWACNSACRPDEKAALPGGGNAQGAGGGGPSGPKPPPAPLHPGQFAVNPASSEPWQEQVAQDRRAAAAGLYPPPAGDFAGDHGTAGSGVPGAQGMMGTRRHLAQ